MLGDQVTDDRVGHRLRGLDAATAVALHLDDVSLLAAQLGGNVIQISFSLGPEDGAARSEGNGGRGDGLVLVEIAYRAIERGGAVAGVGGDPVGGVGAVARIHGVLVGGVGGTHGTVDAGLRARVYIADIGGVLG